MCVHFTLLIALVSVCNNRDLAPKGDGRSDPFATIFFDREQYSTQVSLYTVQQLDVLTLSPWHTVLRSHPLPLLPPTAPTNHMPTPLHTSPFTHHPSHVTLHAPHPCSWCYRQVMQKTRFPRWKKTFELMVPQTSQGAGATAQTSVKVVVYNFDTFSQNQFMGQVGACQRKWAWIRKVNCCSIHFKDGRGNAH